MSLWTPDGEVPVNRRPSSPAPSAAGETSVRPEEDFGPDGPSLDDLSPEERAQAEQILAQMAEAQQQIAEAPGAVIVVNHLAGLYELAAIKLQTQPPQFGDAQLAIDAMAGALDLVESRLGEEGATLRQALTQIQMAFVQIRNQAKSG